MGMLTVLLALVVSLVAPLGAHAADFPERPVHVIVPYTAGSGPDVVARALARVMGARLGGPFVVENKPGANGTIGIEAIAKAPADGYTIGVVVNSFSINPSLYKRVPDPRTTFDPLGLVARGSMVLVVRPGLGVKDLASLAAAARARPAGLTYATPGKGSPQHLAIVLLEQATGMRLVHIPYSGSSTAVRAALSGEVDLMFMPVHTAAPFLSEGWLNALMVSTPRRSSRLPDVPTAQELGLHQLDVDLWYAVVAPTGVRADTLERLRSQVEAALRDPDIIAEFSGQGLEPAYLTPSKFSQLLRSDIARWADVIRRAHIDAN